MEVNLKDGDPLHLTLACDARLGSPDYLNDQIWEVHLNGGAPPAISVETTYGLRAGSMRLFPRFRLKESWVTDPGEFVLPPRVIRIFPNFISLEYSPLKNVKVVSEIWVPESQLVTGRLTFSNTGSSKERFGFEWINLLSHLGEGAGMAVVEKGILHYMEGQTSGLCPVCVMTSGAQAGSGPYASLAFDIELARGADRQITWALATLADAEESLNAARQATTRSWDAEVARIDLMEDSQTLRIETGNPEWDAALMLSQRAANALFFPAGEHLSRQSFVLARQPENGFSMRGDGLDYNHLWNGQTALDTWYLTGILGWTQPERCAGLIENFLATRREDGCLDWKPGMAGQRAKRLAQPILAETAWQIYQMRPDKEWIDRIYPKLLDFVRCWFSPASDRDQDGFPEWEHPFQPGLDGAPLFHPWMEHAQGVDPEVVESPSLAAMLYRECTSLRKMAELLDNHEDSAWLEERCGILKTELERNWSDSRSSYSYRDAAIQDSPPGASILSIRGTGTFPVRQRFESPRRLVLSFHPHDEMTRQSHLLLHGETPEGPVTEEISPRTIHWLHGAGRYTTRHTFTRLVEVVARAMLPGDHCQINTIDFTSEDISLLAPLWAHIPDTDRGEIIIQNTILSRYWQPFGLPVCPSDRCPADEPALSGASLPWNQMIGEGLLDYGHRKEAAELVGGLLRAVAANLKSDHGFWSMIQASTGDGIGERNTLSSFAPLGLFLRTLGLVNISADQVIVDGLNPFSLPVTVQYRGTKVVFQQNHTRVTFAGGQTISVEGDGLQEISLP